MKFFRKSLLIIILNFIFFVHSVQAIDVKNLKGTTLEFNEEFKQQCVKIVVEKMADEIGKEERGAKILGLLEIVSQGFSTGALWWESDLLKKYYEFGEEKDNTIKFIQSLFHFIQGSFGVTGYPAYTAYHISAKLVGKIIGKLLVAYVCGEKVDKKQIAALIREDEDFNKSLEKTKKGIEAKAAREKQKRLKKERNEFEKVVKGLKELQKLQEKIQEKVEIPEETRKRYEEFETLIRKKKKTKEDKKKIAQLSKDEAVKKLINQKKIEKLKKQYENVELEVKEKELKAKQQEIEEAGNRVVLYDTKRATGKRLKEFIEALVGSCEECNFFESYSADQKYAPFMSLPILWTFMYRKMIEKHEFSRYCSGLEEELSKVNAVGNVFVRDFKDRLITDEWKKDVFGVQENQAEEIIEKFSQVVNEKMIETKEFGALIQQALQEVPYEELMYAEITQQSYGAALPKIAEYRSAYFKEKSFPDCADTTQRNLTNIPLFKEKNKIFSIMNLPAELQKSVDFKIKKFYDPKNVATDPAKKENLCTLSEEVENQAVHNVWVEVIPNRPFVSYNRILDTKTQGVYPIGVESIYVGAITGFSKKTDFGEFKKHVKWLDEISLLGKKFDCVEISGHKYIVVDDLKRYALYEIRPSIKNVIILMNQFLGLRVYEDKKIGEVFADPGFNKKYFDVLCNKLDWRIDTSGLGDLDKLDYSSQGISLPVSIRSGEQFTISISLGHAYVKKTKKVAVLPEYQKNVFEWLLNSFVSKADKVVGLQELDFFQITNFLGLYNDENRFNKTVQSVKNISWLQKHLFFLWDVFDNNVKLTLIKNILETNRDLFMNFAGKLIASFPVRGDFYYQREVVKSVKEAKEVVSENKNKLLSALLFAEGFKVSQFSALKCEVFQSILEMSDLANSILQEVIKVAQAAIKSNKRELGLRLFVQLVPKGLVFEEAVKFAQECFEDKKKLRGYFYKLLEILIEKDKGVKEAKKIAKKASESKNEQEIASGLNLFKILVEKGRLTEKEGEEVIELVFKIYPKVFKSFASYSLLNLLGALIEKGKGVEKTKEIAKKASESKNEQEIASGLNLFKILVEKGRLTEKEGEEVIELVFKIYPKVFKTGIRSSLLNLLEALIEKGKGVEKIKEIALELSESKEEQEIIFRLKLFKVLVEKRRLTEKEEEEVIKIAQKHIEKKKWFYEAFYLLEALVKEGKGVKEAKTIAQKASKSSGLPLKQEMGLELLIILVKNGHIYKQEYKEIINIAKEASKSAFDDIKNFGEMLLKAAKEAQKKFEK